MAKDLIDELSDLKISKNRSFWNFEIFGPKRVFGGLGATHYEVENGQNAILIKELENSSDFLSNAVSIIKNGPKLDFLHLVEVRVPC